MGEGVRKSSIFCAGKSMDNAYNLNTRKDNVGMLFEDL